MRELTNRAVPRRNVLRGIGAFAGSLSLTGLSAAQGMLDVATFGILSRTDADRTTPLTEAMAIAVSEGRPLFFPAGDYPIRNLLIPSGVTLIGAARSRLVPAPGDGPLALISGQTGVNLDGLHFELLIDSAPFEGGLVEIHESAEISLRGCVFSGPASDGVRATGSRGTIDQCSFSGHRGAGIFSLDSNGLTISNNRISGCGNGGVLVWGSANRRDGSIVFGNSISGIRADAGGNGQNGNGINVYKADDVVVADNQISDCAFTAVRLNSTNNVLVTGNVCRGCGEVAIFSEFAFSGSIIADNVVDTAAGGISITNLDSGGQLATCSGNLVRNIQPRSEVNPDTVPFGIAAEADTAVTGNVIEAVPGIGIAAGWGPYLRNVAVSGNVIRDVEIGIAVSVAQGAGAAVVNGNVVSGARRAGIAGTAWTEVQSDDLVRDAARYPTIAISGNVVS